MPSTDAVRPDATTHQDPSGRNADSPWHMPAAAWKAVAKRTWQQSSEDNVGLVAAGVAFYAFLALVPLLGATVLTYGLVADPQTVMKHAHALTSVMPADAAQLVAEQLMGVVQTSGEKKGLGILLAIAVALFGARNAAGALITALNIAYEEEESRGFLRVTLLSLGITAVAVVAAVLAMLAVTALGFLENLFPGAHSALLILGKILSYVLLVLGAAAAAATLYRYAPDRKNAKWSWITPGTLFAALGWLLLTLGFGFYVANFGSYNKTYGSLATVVILITWMYLSAYVFLFGAELNSELEHQTAKDTTTGADQPIGQRGAWSADHVAAGGEGGQPPAGAKAPEPAAAVAVPRPASSPPAEPSPVHDYMAARITSRAGSFAGLRKVGMVSAVLSTAGLSLLRRRGREGTGAALVATAAALSLLKRKD